MKRREIILAQLNHEQTETVPYTFSCEPDVAKRLDDYYSSNWRDKICNFMAAPLHVDTLQEKKISDVRV